MFPSLIEDDLKTILSKTDPLYRDEKQSILSESILRNFIKGNITNNDFSKIYDCILFAKAFDKENVLLKSKTLKDYINNAQDICMNIPIIDNINDTRVPVNGDDNDSYSPRLSSQYLRLRDLATALINNVETVYNCNRFVVLKVQSLKDEKIFTHTAWCTKSLVAWEKNTNNKYSLYTIFDKTNYDSFQFAPYTLTFVRYDNAHVEDYEHFSEIKRLIQTVLLQQKKDGFRFDVDGSCSQIILKYFMDSNLYQYIDYEEIKQCVSNKALKGKLIISYVYLSGNAFDALTLIKDTNYEALETLPDFMFNKIKKALQNKHLLVDYGLSDLDINKVYNHVK